MIKFIGILAVITATSLLGINKADKLKKRTQELNLISHLLEDILIQIRFKALPLFEIIEVLKSNKIYNNLDFLHNIDCSIEKPFNISWEESIDSMQTELLSTDIKLLKTFGSSLGTNDINGEISNIEVYKNDFKKIENDAITQFDKKATLYRSMGVLSGVFISIMLI